MRSLPWENKLKTHCNRLHELAGDNLLLYRGARYCRACTKIWNRENRYKYRNTDRYRAQHKALIKKYRKAGLERYGYTKQRILKNVSREALNDALNAVRETGLIKSGEAVVGFWKWKALLYFQKDVYKTVLEIKRSVKTAPLVRPQLIIRTSEHAARLIDKVNGIVPHHLPRDMRDDLISTILLDLMEGRVKQSELMGKIKNYVSACYRSEHDAFKFTSLDVPLGDGEDSRRLIEALPNSAKLWGEGADCTRFDLPD